MATTILNRDLKRYNSKSPINLPQNISWIERLASIAIGAGLISGGIKNIFSDPIKNTVMAAAGGYLVYRGLTGDCPLQTRINHLNAKDRASNINIRTTVYVDRPRQEIYNFWRNLENLSLFMSHLESVKIIDHKRSRWEARLPGNISKVSWYAEIVNDDPGNVIGWKSVEGSKIDNAGKIEFSDAADGHGTIIQAVISYLPPTGGYLKSKIAGFLSPVFKMIVRDDINNFKKYMEKNSQQKFVPDPENFGESQF